MKYRYKCFVMLCEELCDDVLKFTEIGVKFNEVLL